MGSQTGNYVALTRLFGRINNSTIQLVGTSMKTFRAIVFFLASIGFGAQGQDTSGNSQSAPHNVPASTPYQRVDTGANYQVWRWQTFEPLGNGNIVTHNHSVTELASGLNYQNANGQWVPSQEEITPYAQGAVAQQGAYQVAFASDLSVAGAIDMQTPDPAKRLQSDILGLAYFDRSTGNSVLFAQIQSSQGELISSNQVLYPKAFNGVNADVRYTYKNGSFEQDVILREQPPTPESFGLDSATTEIEVLTEFLNPPAPTINETIQPDTALPDDDISWGVMSIAKGKAFDLGEGRREGLRVHVRRQYLEIDGRHILVEGVLISKIRAQLSTLPLQASVGARLPMMASKVRVLPKGPQMQAAAKAKPMKLAAVAPSNKGFVLDYIELNTDQTNYVFQGDTTYYISGEFNCKGTTTFEGGTVVKLDGSGQINTDPAGTVVCASGPYRPAVFTSINDNSVGQTISGSSGTPDFSDVYTVISGFGTTASFHDLRFSYCTIAFSADRLLVLRNCQFDNIDSVAVGGDISLCNVLISCTPLSGIDGAFQLSGGTFTAENLTADGGYELIQIGYGSVNIAMTNCIVTSEPITGDITRVGSFSTNHTVCLPSPASPVYQTVGGWQLLPDEQQPLSQCRHNKHQSGITGGPESENDLCTNRLLRNHVFRVDQFRPHCSARQYWQS